MIECEQGENLIVSAASDPLAHLLAGEGQGKAATQIGFGISATEASEGDTALVGAYVKPLTGHDYPAAGRVRFRWALGSAEANGKQIREFGLLASDGTLIARKVRPAGHDREEHGPESDRDLDDYFLGSESMADLTETSEWPTGIYQLEINDPVQGRIGRSEQHPGQATGQSHPVLEGPGRGPRHAD